MSTAGGSGDLFHWTTKEFAEYRKKLAAARDAGRDVRTFAAAAGHELRIIDGDPVGFELPDSQLRGLAGYLMGLADISDRAIVGALNHVALLWLREIQRHCPVDVGILRESFNISPATLNGAGSPGVFEASVGTNVPYAVYIEFGTRWIAKGRVLEWNYQDPPILVWDAKLADLDDPNDFKVGSKKRQRAVDIQVKAMSIRTGEFMPPMRGSWVQIQEAAHAAIRERLAKALQRQAKGNGGSR